MLLIALYLILVPLAFFLGILIGFLVGWVLWWYELRRCAWRLKQLQKLEKVWIDLIVKLEGMVGRTQGVTLQVRHSLEMLCKAQKM